MKKEKVANGIFWVEIPEADLRILCGCPADCVKHLSKKGFIAPIRRAGVDFESGPNAILLSDTPIQKGSFANLAEFPLLQMFYRQGMIIPGHPNNTGRKPLLIGLGDQVRSQSEYVYRGNYGLSSMEEIEACGVAPEAAREMLAVKKWFAFGVIRGTADLVDARPMDAETVELAPGCIVHRRGFNRYEFLAAGESLEVDLSLGPDEEFEPAYSLPVRDARREPFSVIHVGEGDGWDAGRPCMGSIVCSDGLFHLVDAGPHITHSLEALGIGPAEVEGIFHTHAHDDHFAGLTSLVRSERRLKYYAVPYVRASVQKKLAALMSISEERFSRFFEVHDLVPGEWNRVAGLEVKPVYSPHPVDTTVFLFRKGRGSSRRTYAHLADIASFDVIAKLASADGRPAALSEATRAAFLREVITKVDLKKIDAGGGLIHGNEDDFTADASAKVLLSHGVESTRDAAKTAAAHAATATFGDADVLIPGGARDHFLRTARACLAARFAGCSQENIEPLAACPLVEIPAGEMVSEPGVGDTDIRLIVGGLADEQDPATGASRRLSVGSFAGRLPHDGSVGAGLPCRAVSTVHVVSIPARTYREFLDRTGGPGACRESPVFREALSRCPLFSSIQSEGTLNAIAASMRPGSLPPGQAAPHGGSPELFVLVSGEADIAVGPQLIETIGPGGFWGEDRIVGSAPSLNVARAAKDCTYVAIPADILADIPLVQWELLESFERRLRSFRKGFRFEWSESFRVGVKALDDQHRTLFSVVNALSEAIETSGTLAGHEEEKKSVLDFTRTHFTDEQELMEKHGYPRLDVQKREHAALLEQLDRLVRGEERRARPRSRTAVDYLKDWLITHTLLEDLRYKEFFARKGLR